MLFYLRKWRLGACLWWLLLPPLVWLGMVLRQHPLVDAQPVYRTCARLLISPNSRGSDLEFNPLTDPRTLQEVTQDQELLERVVERSGLSVSWVDLRSQMQVNTTGHLSDKVDMLEISLIGKDPEELEHLGASLVSCLIERMRQLTAGEQDKNLRVLERECQRAEKQFQQCWRRMRQFGVQVNRSEAVRLSQLISSRAELEKELSDLESAALPVQADGALEAEVEKERLALAALRNVYLERSQLVKSQSSRLHRLAVLLQKSQSRALEQARRRKQARSSALQSRLSGLTAELARLQRKQPSVQRVLRSSLLERELQMWQGQAHALRRQLMQAKFDREKRLASLNLVVVEKPERGELMAVPSARWAACRLWLERLPESLFFGLVLSFAIHFLRGQMKTEALIEEAMGLPVLGRIPRMSGELCREWERIKQIGTQHPRGGI